MHILATIDTCALPTKTQFCDEDGYDIIPVRMIRVVDSPFLEHVDNSTISPLVVPTESSEKDFTYYLEEEFLEEEIHTTDKQYEIWREIKLFKLDWVSETKRRAKECEKRREQRAEKMQKKQTPPSFVGKTNFLLEVNAAKSKYSWKQGIGCKTTKELVSLIDVENKRPKTEKKTKRTKQQMEKIEKSKTETKKPEKLTKQLIKEINKQNR